eukprot:TRINITY_DN35153_c0_g1_i1.p1 TRINITY_DN35153_c0_g1~~TRINITY_DN35153_c0_g1_i1.p1  ORF type:complete len:314 (+),score=45.04 TRINITY_DN35153_c0_g1_i1:45-944(+)
MTMACAPQPGVLGYRTIPPPFQQPPMVEKYRESVNVNASGGEKIEVAKQYLREHLSSMHNGRVAECYDAWLTDDVVWMTTKLPLLLRASGKEETCRMYNILLRKMGGPGATISMRVNRVDYNPLYDCISIDVQVSILPIGEVVPRVACRRSTLKFNDEMKISRIIVTPSNHHIFNPITITENRSYGLDLTDDEEELPVDVDEKILSPPSSQRPCNHNNWDPVRVKRKHALLRCRACASQWKLLAAEVTRCPKYYTGCPIGESCTMLHINARKLTYEQRTGMKLQEQDKEVKKKKKSKKE